MKLTKNQNSSIQDFFFPPNACHIVGLFFFLISLQLEAISFASLCYVLELHEIFEMLGFIAPTSNDATTAFTGSCEQVASLYKSMI